MNFGFNWPRTTASDRLEQLRQVSKRVGVLWDTGKCGNESSSVINRSFCCFRAVDLKQVFVGKLKGLGEWESLTVTRDAGHKD